MGTVKGICVSAQKGVRKSEVEKAELRADWGIVGDAHAGDWHRQISLLSVEKIEDFQKKGAAVSFGSFGENLIVEGVDFRSLPVGSRFYCQDVILEMTQIGKECHTHCAIYHQVGDCIMPREGVFAKVVQGGIIQVGDILTVQYPPSNAAFSSAVVTLSDKGFRGERTDESGPAIVSLLMEKGYNIVETLLLPDEQLEIENQLKRLADQRQVNLIVTTGGTGFSKRDCTPEATLAVATRVAPGIAEAIRYGSMSITRRAMLGRGVSVIRNRSLIVNLPGSVKAARESLGMVIDELDHGLKILKGTDQECGSFS